MTDHWQYFDSGAGEPAFNMALDEALLRQSAVTGSPLLRCYQWSEPAATFGYFQRIADLETATHLRPLIRRPTGGGLVPHLNDWTYSLAVPPGHPWYELRAEVSYARMHRWLLAGFAKVGLPTELATCCREELPGQCFAGYEKFDLLHCGRKLAGAAQRRNKFGLLIQGSIQPPPAGVTRAQFMDAMLAAGSDQFSSPASVFHPAADLIQQAGQLAEERYRRDEYNRRR